MALANRNKRHGPDPVVRGKRVMIVMAWVFILLIIIMFGYAEPQMTTMYNRLYSTGGGTGGSPGWDRSILWYAYILMFPLGATASIGLLFNSWRHHRKYDTYSKTLIIAAGISILGVLLFSIYFFVS